MKAEFKKFIADYEKNISDGDIKITAEIEVYATTRRYTHIIVDVCFVGQYVSADKPHLTKQWQQKVTARLRKMGFLYNISKYHGFPEEWIENTN